MADLFLYSYEADCVQHLQKSKFQKQNKNFNLTFRYIDDVLLLNNPKINYCIDVIYHKEPKWANYLDLHLEFDEDGNFSTRLYDKLDDFGFPIANYLKFECNFVSTL